MSLLSELEEEGFVLPDFRNSILEVAKELGRYSGRLVGDKDKKIFILIDGMGYELLMDLFNEKHSLKKEFEKVRVEKITTIFTSSTMNVLSTLYSGRTTAEHGVVGSHLFLKESGIMIDSIKLAPAMDKHVKSEKINAKRIFLSNDTIKSIKANGKRFKIIMPSDIVNSGLSVATFDKEDIIPYITVQDMIVKLRKGIVAENYDCVLAYSYDIDTIEHVYGSESEEAHHALYSLLESILMHVLPLAKEHGYDLIITADHGQINTKFEDLRIVRYDDMLMKYLDMPLWGSSRAVFMKSRNGEEDKLEEYISKRFRDEGILIRSEEAIRSGLFGAPRVSDELRYRFGDYLYLPKGPRGLYFLYPEREQQVYDYKGMHGGLSSREMYIPLVLG